MNKFICFAFLCCLIGCNKDKQKTDDKEEPPASIEGKWVPNLLYYIIQDYDSMVYSEILDGPFNNGQAGLIEYVKFTTDSLYLKMSDEPSIDVKPVKYFYKPEIHRILINDGVNTDTLFYIVDLKVKDIQFLYNKSDTLNGRIRRSHYNYRASKQ